MASQPPALSRLAQLHILVMDNDSRIADLIKRVLFSLGFKHIHYAKNGQEGLDLLKTEKIDMVITDWDMQPMSGIDFITFIRTSDESPNRLLPIIMLTGKAQQHHVTAARDAGITEFVVKPFSAKTICDRITLVIEHPRNFVLSPTFTGPDRRRRDSNIKDDRRANIDVKNIPTTEIAGKKISKPSEDVTIINADYRLKEKIGKHVSIRDLFSPEALKRAQQVISDSTDEFITLIRDDLEFLERYYTLITHDTKAQQKREDIETLTNVALSVKSRAGTFNYALASHVAESLYNILVEKKHISEKHARAVRIHIDTLYVIFNETITEMGGLQGKEIIEMLFELIKRLD